jgi:hypothetical protein
VAYENKTVNVSQDLKEMILEGTYYNIYNKEN